MKTCFLFPGQGAQYPGMGKDLYESSQKVKSLFESASDATGKDLKKLLFEGSEEELKITANTQVAVTLVNLSSSIVLKERGIIADGAAGFSLGEYSALRETGVISDSDIFSVVKIRGELMEKASRKLDNPAGSPGMAAVLGLPFDEALEAMEKLKGEEIYVANYSSPIQIVLSGTASALAKGEKVFLDAGAFKYITLKVSGPFHSPLLKEAADGLKEALESVTFNDPAKPVYANVTGKRIESGAEAKQLCVEQVTSMVRWVDEEQSILDNGFERFIETGPGSVLTNLWKSFYKKIRCEKAGTMEDMATFRS